jgi:AraC-like DNA-binding protein
MILEHKTFDLYGKMVFERAIIKAPISKPNPMPDEACFLFVKKGVVTSYGEKDKVTVQANEGILMKCGTYLAKMLKDSEEGTYEAIAVHFYPEVLNQVFESGLPSFLQSGHSDGELPALAKVNEDDLFTKFFDGMVYYFTHPQLVNDELITLKLKEILLLLHNTTESEKLHHLLANLFAPHVYSFKNIIEAHLFDNMTLDELAYMCGLSLSSFKRNFKAIFQESPARYIRDKRLDKAAELLKNPAYSISDVAYKCAFSDVGHFSKCFRARFGYSPRHYRKDQGALS